MLTQPDFWELEKEDSLLKMNTDGYLTGDMKQVNDLIERTNKWYEIVKSHTKLEVPKYNPNLDVSDLNETTTRIIELDVIRTLKSDRFRPILPPFLRVLAKTFGCYGQPMCLISAFLRLTLPEDKVFEMMYIFHNEGYYIPGYMDHKALIFAADSYVAQEVLKEECGEGFQYVAKLMPMPYTYMRRIFTAVGIHVFTYENLYKIFENFVNGGSKYLIQLMASIFICQNDDFLNANYPKVFGLLALESNYTSAE